MANKPSDYDTMRNILVLAPQAIGQAEWNFVRSDTTMVPKLLFGLMDEFYFLLEKNNFESAQDALKRLDMIKRLARFEPTCTSILKCVQRDPLSFQFLMSSEGSEVLKPRYLSPAQGVRRADQSYTTLTSLAVVAGGASRKRNLRDRILESTLGKTYETARGEYASKFLAGVCANFDGITNDTADLDQWLQLVTPVIKHVGGDDLARSLLDTHHGLHFFMNFLVIECQQADWSSVLQCLSRLLDTPNELDLVAWRDLVANNIENYQTTNVIRAPPDDSEYARIICSPILGAQRTPLEVMCDNGIIDVASIQSDRQKLFDDLRPLGPLFGANFASRPIQSAQALHVAFECGFEADVLRDGSLLLTTWSVARQFDVSVLAQPGKPATVETALDTLMESVWTPLMNDGILTETIFGTMRNIYMLLEATDRGNDFAYLFFRRMVSAILHSRYNYIEGIKLEINQAAQTPASAANFPKCRAALVRISQDILHNPTSFSVMPTRMGAAAAHTRYVGRRIMRATTKAAKTVAARAAKHIPTLSKVGVGGMMAYGAAMSTATSLAVDTFKGTDKPTMIWNAMCAAGRGAWNGLRGLDLSGLVAADADQRWRQGLHEALSARNRPTPLAGFSFPAPEFGPFNFRVPRPSSSPNPGSCSDPETSMVLREVRAIVTRTFSEVSTLREEVKQNSNDVARVERASQSILQKLDDLKNEKWWTTALSVSATLGVALGDRLLPILSRALAYLWSLPWMSWDFIQHLHMATGWTFVGMQQFLAAHPYLSAALTTLQGQLPIMLLGVAGFYAPQAWGFISELGWALNIQTAVGHLQTLHPDWDPTALRDTVTTFVNACMKQGRGYIGVISPSQEVPLITPPNGHAPPFQIVGADGPPGISARIFDTVDATRRGIKRVASFVRDTVYGAPLTQAQRDQVGQTADLVNRLRDLRGVKRVRAQARRHCATQGAN